MSATSGSMILLWVAVLVLGLAVGALLARIEVLTASLDGVARNLQRTRTASPQQASLQIKNLPCAVPAVLAFVDGRCRSCRVVAEQLAGSQFVREPCVEVVFVADDASADTFSRSDDRWTTAVDPLLNAECSVPEHPWLISLDGNARVVRDEALHSADQLIAAQQELSKIALLSND